MRTISDGSLVRRARGGGEAAATELFERHWPRAWRLALAVTGDRGAADDAAQVGLIRAFASLGSFDDSRPFGPWLNRIVTRAAIDHMRADPGHLPLEGEASAAALVSEDAVELPERLALALLALERDRRVVLALRYWGDFGVDEIAELLGVPAGTVASRLSRGLAELRQRIEDGSHARPRL